MTETPRVVKVGGSLYAWPDLGPRLQHWLGTTRSIIVPGGGAAADAVRALDQVHRLGEETAHWLALRAMSLNAYFLARLVPEATVVTDPADAAACGILDALPYFTEDKRRPDHLPHTWDVTSDSLAVRVAIRAAASELVLLKSVSWPAAANWVGASAAGVVDAFFPRVLQQAPRLRVRIVNLRAAEDSIPE